MTDINDEFPEIHDDARQEQQLEKILAQVEPYQEESKQSQNRRIRVKPSLEMDMRSFNSRYDIKTHAGSKLMDDAELIELHLMEKHLSTMAKSAVRGREHRDTKQQRRKSGNRKRQTIKEHLAAKQQVLPFKKSFRSEKEGKNSVRDIINRDNYSASASSIEPMQDET